MLGAGEGVAETEGALEDDLLREETWDGKLEGETIALAEDEE